MRHTTKQYARALYGALDAAGSEKRHGILKHFYAYIVRHRELGRMERILEEVERIYNEGHGMHSVVVESASPLSSSLKKEIQEIFRGKAVLRESIRSELLGGVKCIIDRDTVIDASAAGQLRKLFS